MIALNRVTAPWWTIPAAFLAGLFFPMGGSDAATDELRDAVEAAEVDRELWRAKYLEAAAVNDSLAQEHEAETAEAETRIAEIEGHVQATQERAAEITTEIRSRVDDETAGLVDELESAHAEVVAAKDSTIAEERALRLSAEAGWRNARLALVSAERALEASERAHASKDALIRALESDLRRANRHKRVIGIATIAGAAWVLTR